MEVTVEKLEMLEEEEHGIAEEAILASIVLLNLTKREIENELRSFYQEYGTDGVVTYSEARKWVSEKDHRKRLTVLLLVISSQFTLLQGRLNKKFSIFLSEIIMREGEFFKVDLSDLSYAKWGADNLTWSERLANDINLWMYNVQTDLKQSLLKRDSLKDVLKKVDKRFTSMEYVLTKLGYTEGTANNSYARKAVFSELGIKRYMFYTRADARVCEICAPMHGLIFPISAYSVGVTASPLHPFVDASRFLLWTQRIKKLNTKIIGGYLVC